jgi:predicted SAM-dependent methyltransferase
MKLNIGSGYPKGQYTGTDWVNIDDAPEGTFDSKHVTKASVMSMPEDWTNKFEEVHCIHMLEHLNRNWRQDVVKQICRVTAPGGTAYIEVPDFRVVILLLHNAMEADNREIEHNMTTSIYGKQRYQGDQHCWGFTKRTLHNLCTEAGFSKVSVDPSMWAAGGTPANTRFKPISSHYKHEPVILATCIK